MPKFLREIDIDHLSIIARGGSYCGNVNFWAFKCPHCNHVYLVDLEVESVYPDASNLSRRVEEYTPDIFPCEDCGQPLQMKFVWNSYQIAEGYWEESPELVSWLVTRDIFRQSPWAWCLANSPQH